jgi:predicted nucleic acid-binding protein
MGRIIIDAGPLVALLDTDDQFHPWAKPAVARLEPFFSTCDAVLSETCYLLGENSAALSKLRLMVENEIVSSEFISSPELPAVFDLMERYADIPMSFADACLVRMVEQNPGSTVFTTDRHFNVYRQHRRRLIPLMPRFHLSRAGNHETKLSAGLVCLEMRE